LDENNGTFLEYQKRASSEKVKLSTMRLNGFDLFSFDPASLNKHEARAYSKAQSSFWLLSFVKVAALVVLIILISGKANRNVGTIKLES
jgi:hypothetical protein